MPQPGALSVRLVCVCAVVCVCAGRVCAVGTMQTAFQLELRTLKLNYVLGLRGSAFLLQTFPIR